MLCVAQVREWSAQLERLPTLEDMAAASTAQRKKQGNSAAHQPPAVRCVYVVLSNALLKWHPSRADSRQGHAARADKHTAHEQEKRAAGKKVSRFGQLGG